MSAFNIFQEADFTEPWDFEEIHVSPSEDVAHSELKILAQKYNLHTLTVEDCVHRNQRSKFEAYPNYLFVVWHYFNEKSETPLELHFVFGRKHILLIHNGASPKGCPWRETFFGAEGELPAYTQSIRRIFDVIVDDASGYLDVLTDRVSGLEDSILSLSAKPGDILSFKRRALELDRCLSTGLPIMTHLIEHLHISLDEKFQFRNINDHLTRMQENVGHLRFQLVSLLDVYWGATGERTNQHIKRLTTIATLFIPVSLWGSIFGMNFEFMPFKEVWFFWAGMGVMFLNFLLVLLYLFWSGLLHFKREQNKFTLRD